MDSISEVARATANNCMERTRARRSCESRSADADVGEAHESDVDR